jgi:hypothetical protein
MYGGLSPDMGSFTGGSVGPEVDTGYVFCEGYDAVTMMY